MSSLRLQGILFMMTFSMTTMACASSPVDPYLPLEEIHSEKSLNWVRERNQRATTRLESDARFALAKANVKEILEAKDRIITPNRKGSWVEDFYQDADHRRGILRHASLESYRSGTPDWETLFDVDELGQKEGKSWVWHGLSCLPPLHHKCLAFLSEGGKDAEVIREWDSVKREFVANGFILPEAKSSVTWYDENTLLVATDFGEGTMTESGYARQVKLWKRGTPLSEAQLLFEIPRTEIWARPFVSFRPEGRVTLLIRGKTFFEEEAYVYRENGTLAKLPTGPDFEVRGIFLGKVIGTLRKHTTITSKKFEAGTLLAFDLHAWKAEKIHAPDAKSALLSIDAGKSRLLITVLKNVRAQIIEAKANPSGGWALNRLPLPEMGMISVLDLWPYEDDAFLSYQSFFEPTQLIELRDHSTQKLKQLPPRFDPTGMKAEQKWAISKDGTRIPYFLLTSSKSKKAGPLPTLLYGYGGFEISETPFYASSVGKLWLERGGAYALANIRGGGEFGPRWHQAALKENRQRAFDDFAAVAEHLISTDITSPRKLAIQGGSNGGLLMGATFTQRPELFRAVICQVPLLDMLRYHQLLAGASWVAEYGNPDIAEEREYILKYSPYQNLRKDAKYPEVLFMTSTEDDRVHPGHARKMAARMEELGHPFLYFENMEGGHGAAADLEQRARMAALQYTFLFQTLMD